jgi:hypothetical protein
MYVGLHAKYCLFLSDYNETWIFSANFGKNEILSFVKIRPVRAELFLAGGRTDKHHGLIVTFRNYANAPKNTFPLHRIPDPQILRC